MGYHDDGNPVFFIRVLDSGYFFFYDKPQLPRVSQKVDRL